MPAEARVGVQNSLIAPPAPPSSLHELSGRFSAESDGSTSGSLTELASEPHHLWRWCSSRLAPRRRIFYDPHARGHVIVDSRAHRKHRHARFEPDPAAWGADVVARGPVPRLVRVLPSLAIADLLNVSWQVAAWFTVGSVAWIVNGHILVWPKGGDPNLSFNQDATAYSGLAGGLFFWVGAYLAVAEALNEDKKADTRVEVRSLANKSSGGRAAALGAYHVRYSSECKGNSDLESNGIAEKAGGEHKTAKGRSWRWWGVDASSLGWWASAVQFFGATLFTVSVITSLPGVLSSSQWRVMVALVWAAQVVGSVAFLLSSVLLMVEEQRAWWKPAFERIGWHSAAWNTAGSVGFLLSAVFGWLGTWGGGGVCCRGLAPAISSYAGSWAFLISSVLLLLEAQNPHQAGLGAHLRRVAAEAAAAARCDTQKLAEELEEDVESIKGGDDGGKREEGSEEDGAADGTLGARKSSLGNGYAASRGSDLPFD